jgi:hypothetical protein
MIPNIGFVLRVFAFVLFVISAFPQVTPYWYRLISIGLACWVLSLIIA